MQFRKKPVVIEAVEWDGNTELANSFIGEAYGQAWEYERADSREILVNTLEGKMLCHVGDWIIKGVEGEFYPCKPSVFAATYEPVEVEVPA